MHIHLKSHVKTELITLCVSLIPAYIIYRDSTKDLFPYMSILVVCAILGLVNSVYLFTHLCAHHYVKTQSQAVLLLLSWPLQWYAFIFLSIPIIVIELIMLCKGKTYIGKECEEKSLTEKAKQSYTALNKREKQLYDEYRKAYQKAKGILILILSIVFALYYYLTTRLKNDHISIIIGSCLVLICIIFLPLWRMKFTVKFTKNIHACLIESCDSKTYYHISKALCETYPRDIILVRNYFRSLQLDDNDFTELKEALMSNRRYKSRYFYQIAYMDTLSATERLHFIDKYGEKIEKTYEKAYQKSGKITIANELTYWQIRKCKLKGQYKEAYHLCKSIKDDGTKLGKVLYFYEKGICQFHLNQREEAEKAFTYVGTEGNTLRVKRLANMYLDDLHAN